MTKADYILPPGAPVAVPVSGSDALFPVRRIYCVGRNYAEHIREMGGDERKPPFFFQKPTDAVVGDGCEVPYPSATADFQHEIELVLAIGLPGENIPVAQAADHIFAQGVGIDLTRRDAQLTARNEGRPWEIGKAFDNSAPLGLLVPVAQGALLSSGAISLSVNGQTRQIGDLDQMIWNSAEIVSELSRLYRLEPGDLIYTGTPAGVGPLVPGDVVVGQIAALPSLSVTVVERQVR